LAPEIHELIVVVSMVAFDSLCTLLVDWNGSSLLQKKHDQQAILQKPALGD
jgi:hypothetical protein